MDFQVSPSCSATSPPAPQMNGSRPNVLSPATGNGIMSGLLALIFWPAARSSSQLVGGSMLSSLNTSAR